MKRFPTSPIKCHIYLPMRQQPINYFIISEVNLVYCPITCDNNFNLETRKLCIDVIPKLRL